MPAPYVRTSVILIRAGALPEGLSELPFAVEPTYSNLVGVLGWLCPEDDQKSSGNE
jgi:hypothetical protein